MPEFQSHNTLRLLLLRVSYIRLQRKSNNFHRLTIKTKGILGLQLEQMLVKVIVHNRALLKSFSMRKQLIEKENLTLGLLPKDF